MLKGKQEPNLDVNSKNNAGDNAIGKGVLQLYFGNNYRTTVCFL